jgi:Holliday junction DNA helicase RuvA
MEDPMIGYLRGKVLFVEDGLLVVDAGGVGYEVHASAGAIDLAGQAGNEVELFIHTQMRENEIGLFGFSTREERSLFELLLTVNGVGNRLAMVMVSSLGVETFVQSVLAGNPIPFTRIKGIGQKTAERVILDLRGKVGKLFGQEVAQAVKAGRGAPSAALLEAQEALVALGYRRPEILPVLGALKEQQGASVEDLLKEALKRLRK